MWVFKRMDRRQRQMDWYPQMGRDVTIASSDGGKREGEGGNASIKEKVNV